MGSFVRLTLIGFLTLLVPVACIDPINFVSASREDVLVVDGTITDFPEPQIIKLNRAQVDRFTGEYRTVPVTKATVEVMVDSAEVISCHETVDGSYQLPSDFRGRVGHTYQLRFTLDNGATYASDHQRMTAVPPIASVNARFNPNSLPVQLLKGYQAAHDIYINSRDPANEKNYYRWTWKLWARKYYCKSCRQGVYSVYKVLPNRYQGRDYFVTGTELYQDCFSPPAGKAGEEAPEVPAQDWIYDYECASPCWQIINGYDIVALDDRLINGRPIAQLRVGQIPFYDAEPCLVDVRQLSLSPDAYAYYKLFEQQTQRTGGLADVPATALGGNVRKVDDPRVTVVGYFSASAVSQVHYWLDRKDAQGISFGSYGALSTGDTLETGTYGRNSSGLFYAFNDRLPNVEPSPPYLGERSRPKVRLWPFNDRPPLVPCLLTDGQTPFKPEGWRD